MSRSAILKQIPGCGSSAVEKMGFRRSCSIITQETRAKFHAASFLQGFSGYLETDGYQGYNNLPDIKRCSCWAHVRRYFTDAIPKGKEYDYSLPAVQGVQFCSKLFDCERYSKAKNHTAEQRKQFRLEKEKPILEAVSYTHLF